MPRTDNFQKFVKQKKAGTVKEEIRQHKKKEKKERAAAIEAHFERKRAERLQKQQPVGADTAKTARPNKYPKKVAEDSAPKSLKTDKYSKKVTENPAPKSVKPDRYPKKVTENSAPKSDKPGKYSKKVTENPAPKSDKPDRYPKKVTENLTQKFDKPGKYPEKAQAETEVSKKTEKVSAEKMPLNKYIAHSGVCSRRDAAELVKEGKVTVNDTLATDPGMKISGNDSVKIGNKRITPSKNFVYILLNKPKDFITTSEDPQGRRTVLDLVRTATDERVYPVGRLDRNTSGVLLLTNDGELAQKLSHPSHEIKKLYEVTLDRSLTRADLDKIATGITLEDGFVAPDVIAYADAKDKSIIGVEIHSGRNRIVRRIFEHLKYDVRGLDRVMYAGLTKKDVQRGRWRFLKDKEIRLLKFMNQSMVKVKD